MWRTKGRRRRRRRRRRMMRRRRRQEDKTEEEEEEELADMASVILSSPYHGLAEVQRHRPRAPGVVLRFARRRRVPRRCDHDAEVGE
jgi:hypothetical protein